MTTPANLPVVLVETTANVVSINPDNGDICIANVKSGKAVDTHATRAYSAMELPAYYRNQLGVSAEKAKGLLALCGNGISAIVAADLARTVAAWSTAWIAAAAARKAEADEAACPGWAEYRRLVDAVADATDAYERSTRHGYSANTPAASRTQEEAFAARDAHVAAHPAVAARLADQAAKKSAEAAEYFDHE